MYHRQWAPQSPAEHWLQKCRKVQKERDWSGLGMEHAPLQWDLIEIGRYLCWLVQVLTWKQFWAGLKVIRNFRGTAAGSICCLPLVQVGSVSQSGHR